mmetsp:Transcript_10259/g.33894  ORF Transcript_10259/g.33894 Transcript_10259/m.33894 type:complete len:277 (-) Transcript_10259:2256-3086(-)
MSATLADRSASSASHRSISGDLSVSVSLDAGGFFGFSPSNKFSDSQAWAPRTQSFRDMQKTIPGNLSAASSCFASLTHSLAKFTVTGPFRCCCCCWGPPRPPERGDPLAPPRPPERPPRPPLPPPPLEEEAVPPPPPLRAFALSSRSASRSARAACFAASFRSSVWARLRRLSLENMALKASTSNFFPLRPFPRGSSWVQYISRKSPVLGSTPPTWSGTCRSCLTTSRPSRPRVFLIHPKKCSGSRSVADRATIWTVLGRCIKVSSQTMPRSTSLM